MKSQRRSVGTVKEPSEQTTAGVVISISKADTPLTAPPWGRDWQVTTTPDVLELTNMLTYSEPTTKVAGLLFFKTVLSFRIFVLFCRFVGITSSSPAMHNIHIFCLSRIFSRNYHIVCPKKKV